MDEDDSVLVDDFQMDDEDDVNPIVDMKQNEKQPQDFDTPFSPPDGVQDRISDTHQHTDSNIDETQRYTGGLEDATGIDLPGQAADEDPEEPERVWR